MNLDSNIASRYWRLATVEQVASDLRSEGYVVQVDGVLEGLRADIVARRGTEVRVYEFKGAEWSAERSDEAKRLRNYVVHELGADFTLVWVTPPVERDVEIDDFETRLFEHLMDNLPSSLDALSSHTTVEDVSGVEIRNLHLRAGRTAVSGDAVVEVTLVYGSGRDEEGSAWSDAYPMKFEVTLNEDLEICEDEDVVFEIDTSAFYE